MMEHTPGPWEVEENGRANVQIAGRVNGGYLIAQMIEGSPCRDANARLIAAAPESNEACEFLVKGLTYLLEEGPLQDRPARVLSVVSQADKLARLAIAKATGI